MNDFTDAMHALDDQQLVELLALHRDEYNPSAIEAAEREAASRGLQSQIDYLYLKAQEERIENEEKRAQVPGKKIMDKIAELDEDGRGPESFMKQIFESLLSPF